MLMLARLTPMSDVRHQSFEVNQLVDVWNGTFVTHHTCQKHQAADFHQLSQQHISQAIENLDIEEDDNLSDTDETIRRKPGVSDSDSEDEESQDVKVEHE
ncbi:hypothetical protein CROQUDRAFT_96298 [Cronartium quercuum f. sp. fusiforme G11]|uniref:Uncharacterized protein n=1 Tax=Cronartium quercuum f. sp. fusiforme G11 TaxID=708437 RepID=A0A9P6NGX7_9BASI|nr:hypothetical protein CROQUDRAFT_96298 [Cronartium quercuum f. sp. fusiforme G11]